MDINKIKYKLTLKNITKEDEKEIEKQYKKGDNVKGTVTKFSAFGAFVEIAPKIRGLCHVS
mgnify:CR=1 FL=1